MPTRADLSAAVPKCPRIIRRTGLGVVKEWRCGKPMRYMAGDGNTWRCPTCMQTTKGLLMAQWSAEQREAA